MVITWDVANDAVALARSEAESDLPIRPFRATASCSKLVPLLEKLATKDLLSGMKLARKSPFRQKCIETDLGVHRVFRGSDTVDGHCCIPSPTSDSTVCCSHLRE